MSHIRLEHLILRNFKGVRDFTLDAQCDDVAVFGQNAAGKSTLLDAFTWLLFSKDSLNQSDFEIKTLTAEGESLHNLSHEVEALLLVDGRPVHLRKVYAEKWTKKRGQAHQEFSGHTTDHFIDGVPVQKKEYDQRVAAIAGESAFRLLTSPTYFNEALDWKKRRALLLEICGDVSDAEVVESDKGLAALPEILGNRSLEDQRKVIDAKRKEINKELQGIPARIDEATKALPSVSDVSNPSALDSDIANLRAEAETLRSNRAQIASGGAVAEKRVELREAEAEIQRLRNEHEAAENARSEGTRRALSDAQYRARCLGQDISHHKSVKRQTKEDVAALEARRAAKVEEWERVSAETLVPIDHATTCPACGQNLPADQIKAAHAKAEADFMRSRSQRLEVIVAEGQSLRARIDTGEAAITATETAIADLEEQFAAADAEALKLASELEALSAQSVAETPAYMALLDRKTAIQAEVTRLQADSTEAVAKADAEIRALEESVKALEGARARLEQRQTGEVRIAQLQDDEKRLAAEFEKLEAQIFLCERFVRAKVSLLTERINDRFKLARFKLFDVQINEGIREVCETTVNGVPYSSLNHGHRIAAGIDICNVLSEHYGLTAPIWLDNSESLTVPIETNAQLIRLVVSEADKALRVDLVSEREAV